MMINSNLQLLEFQSPGALEKLKTMLYSITINGNLPENFPNSK